MKSPLLDRAIVARRAGEGKRGVKDAGFEKVVSGRSTLKTTKAPHARTDFVSFVALRIVFAGARDGLKATKDTHAHVETVSFVALGAGCGSGRFQRADPRLARRDKVGKRFFADRPKAVLGWEADVRSARFRCVSYAPLGSQ
jgi:hypothetical protein